MKTLGSSVRLRARCTSRRPFAPDGRCTESRSAARGVAGSLRAGTPSRLSDDTRFAGAFSVSNDGNTAAFIGESATAPPEVYVATLPSGAMGANRHRDG